MSVRQIQRILLVITALLILSPDRAAAANEQQAGGPDSSAPVQETGDANDGGHHLNWFDYGNKEAPPLAILIFNFIVLGVLVYFIVRKSLGERFKNRKLVLEEAIAEAAEMKARAEKALADARAKSAALDSEMAKLRMRLKLLMLISAPGIGSCTSTTALANIQDWFSALLKETNENSCASSIRIATSYLCPSTRLTG